MPELGLRLAALLLLLAASACGGIPTGGEVVAEREVVDVEVPDEDRLLDQQIRRLVDAQGPVAGATPDEIVDGFFDAHAAERGIAERFLASTAVWPGREVLVHAGERQMSDSVVSGNQARVVVTVQQRGRLSATGEYSPLRPSALAVEVVLQRVEDEWRLRSVPPYLLLSEGAFRTAYRRTKIYFPDPRRQHLVPDLVFLPASRNQARAVAARLLEGPSSWLRNAVRTVVPPGLRLLAPPTAIRGGVEVNLSIEANSVPSDARRALAAQIVRSLTEPGMGITEVRILVEGRGYAIPGVGAGKRQTRATWASFDPVLTPTDARLHFLRDGDLQVLDAESQSSVTEVQAGNFRRIAVSREHHVVAAIERKADGREVLVVGTIGGAQRTVVEAESLSTPTWTRSSESVWVVRRSGGTSDLLAVPREASGAPGRPVAVQGLTEPIWDVRLSPDGNRAALVVGAAGRRRLMRAAVETGATGPVLTSLVPMAPALADVSVATWYDDEGLEVVATQPAAAGGAAVRALFRVDIDGYELSGDSTGVEGLPRAPDAVAAAPTKVTVVEVAGIIYKRAAGRGWDVIGPGSAPTYPG